MIPSCSHGLVGFSYDYHCRILQIYISFTAVVPPVSTTSILLPLAVVILGFRGELPSEQPLSQMLAGVGNHFLKLSPGGAGAEEKTTQIEPKTLGTDS